MNAVLGILLAALTVGLAFIHKSHKLFSIHKTHESQAN
jgi:hypothetical protein